jgi:hypothetical protein
MLRVSIDLISSDLRLLIIKSAVSWSGLFYLALFLCSKFAISIPFLPPKRLSVERPTDLDAYVGSGAGILPVHNDSTDQTSGSFKQSADPSNRTLALSKIPPRNQAAAPPVYLLALPLVPICTAIYITSTRYFQFFHHGFDMIAGMLIGILSAWFAFRWYHLPISQGAGWAWGARTRDRAWAIGVGVPGYVGTEGWFSESKGIAATDGVPNHPVLGPGYDGSQEDQRDIQEARGDTAA